MTDTEIARRLQHVHAIKTPSHGVVNELIAVGLDRVTIRSERTGRTRDIYYEQIRNADSPTMTQNGVIIRVLAQILGL